MWNNIFSILQFKKKKRKKGFWKVYPPLTVRCQFFHSVRGFLSRIQSYSSGPFCWKAFSLVMGNEKTLKKKKKKMKYPLKWVKRSHLFFMFVKSQWSICTLLQNYTFLPVISIYSAIGVLNRSVQCSFKWLMRVHVKKSDCRNKRFYFLTRFLTNVEFCLRSEMLRQLSKKHGPIFLSFARPLSTARKKRKNKLWCWNIKSLELYKMLELIQSTEQCVNL